MAESHVVTRLVAKRAELAGQIQVARRELEQLEANVDHLDGAIKLFDPDYKLEGIRTKTPRRGNRFFSQGECQRLVLEIFRDAAQPLSAACLAEAWPSVKVWSRVRRCSSGYARVRWVR